MGALALVAGSLIKQSRQGVVIEARHSLHHLAEDVESVLAELCSNDSALYRT